jgi:twitching motility protein PilT
VVGKLALLPRGLVLVTGPTGSGKSTTLAAIVDEANRKRKDHIITIEDPIEFVHTSQNCIINHRELGTHTRSFGAALRGALREDPDIILVGEMRDLETISTAITAAETGHLVFATLHTTGCQGTINRIIDVYPEREQEQIRTQLSVTLICIISQTLIPRADGSGRVAAFEILVMTSAISNLIRQQKSYQIDSEIQTGTRLGMIPLDKSLLNLYAQGIISKAEVLARCRNIPDVQETMDKIVVGEGMARQPQLLGAEPTPPVGSGK